MTSQAPTAAVSDLESSSARLSPQRRNLVFVAVLLGMLLAALDQTIVATALPTVVADLGGAGHQILAAIDRAAGKNGNLALRPSA